MTFSIIIPAYNAADRLGKGLESIRAQTCKDYELIVVCDRCTDGTDKVAEEYGADKVIHVDFGNDGLTRNAGIEAAAGDWVLFMDDDDWWLHEFAFMEIWKNVAFADDLDVLLFGFIFRNVGIAHPLRIHNEVWPAVWNKCYRREFIKDLKFHAIKYESALDWTNRLLDLDPRIKMIDQPLYYYNYMRPGSLTWELEQ